MARWIKATVWTVGILAGLVLIITLGLLLADDPLRGYIEERVNRSLDGYTFKIEDLDIHPFNLGLTFHRMILSGEESPNHPPDHPPVHPMVEIGQADFSIDWVSLTSGRLIADLDIINPVVRLDSEMFRSRRPEEKAKQEQGWQAAVRQMYPFEINRLEVRDGDFTYAYDRPEPIEIHDIDLSAADIRNVSRRETPYPTPVGISATLFDGGDFQVDGKADFLTGAQVHFQADYSLKDAGVEFLKPIVALIDIRLEKGRLASSRGRIEFTPDARRLIIQRMEIDQAKFDYIHPDYKLRQKDRKSNGNGDSGKDEKSGRPFHWVVEKLLVTGEAGFVNRSTDPAYRVYLDQGDFTGTDLSDGYRKGRVELHLEGRFMGSGLGRFTAAFKNTEKGADVELAAKIVGTRLERMNDLLRAYSDLDVVDGSFSLYGEMTVKNGEIDGYVKPFFGSVDIYSERQDKREGLLDKSYEAFAGVMVDLLGNRPQGVATKVDLSGQVEDPGASTWQIIANLIRNAFFDAILPGFEQSGLTSSPETGSPVESAAE